MTISLTPSFAFNTAGMSIIMPTEMPPRSTAAMGSSAPGSGKYTATSAETKAPSMMPPSAPRLNWLAENMTQVARTVKMMGIMAASTSVRCLTLTVPLLRKAGPMSSCRRALPVWAILAPKVAPSAEMKMSTVATSRAMRIAAVPRTSVNIRLLF